MGRLRRDRGISVARPTALGNPFTIGVDGDRNEVIEKYRGWIGMALETDANVRRALDAIVAAGRNGDVTLLCFCAPKPCHADIVAEIVRERLVADE